MENKEVVEENQSENLTAEEYVTAIEKLKANTVSKEEYERLKGDNQTLLNAVLNGASVPEQKEEPHADVDEMRKRLYQNDIPMSNREYVERTLALRKEIINSGKKDPFCAANANVPSVEEQSEATHLADCLQHCLDVADGNDDIFNQELTRITVDSSKYARRI